MSEIHEDSFIFYRSFYEAMDGQSDADRLALYDAIARLALNGEKAELPPAPRGLFTLIIPQIEANRIKRAYGRKGGRPPRKETNGYRAEETNGYKKQKPNVNKNENENENVNENKSTGKTRRFTPPTNEEVKTYCVEQGYRIDHQKFIDFYTANGWKVGKNTMKDWKAALRYWVKNNAQRGKSFRERNTLKNYDEKGVSYANLGDISLDLDEL